MSETSILILLFLPVILISIAISAIQIWGDLNEVRHRLKRRPKLSVITPLSAKHIENIEAIDMLQKCGYKNIEIILLANSSNKKVLGQIKYYRKKQKLNNVKVLTAKRSKKRALDGHVEGKFMIYLPLGHKIAKNSLVLAISRLQSKQGQRLSTALVLLPPLDNSLKNGLYFTQRAILAHLSRIHRLPTGVASTQMLSKSNANTKNKNPNITPAQKLLKNVVQWGPLAWLFLWLILFGFNSVGVWIIVISLLLLFGFFVQFNLKDYPLHTRICIILLTPISIFIPTHIDIK